MIVSIVLKWLEGRYYLPLSIVFILFSITTLVQAEPPPPALNSRLFPPPPALLQDAESLTPPTPILEQPLSPIAQTLSIELVQESEQALEEMQKTLEQDQSSLTREEQSLQARQAELSEITDNLLEQAEINRQAASVELEKLRLELQGAESSLEKQRELLNALNTNLSILQKSPISADESALYEERLIQLRDSINTQTNLIELRIQIINVLKQRLTLANHRYILKTEWYQTLRQKYQQQQNQSLERRMLAKQQSYLLKAADLRQELANSSNQDEDYQSYLLEANIHELEGRARMVMRELELSYIEQALTKITDTAPENVNLEQRSPSTLQALLVELQTVQADIRETRQLLKDKNSLLDQQIEVLNKRKEISSRNQSKLNETVKNLQAFFDDQKIQLERLTKMITQSEQLQQQLEKGYQQALRQTLLRRRDFSFDEQGLQAILAIGQMPALFQAEIQRTAEGINLTLQQTSQERWLTISLVILLWLSVFIWARVRLRQAFKLLSNEKNRSFSSQLLLIGLRLLHFNALSIALAGIFLLLVWFAEPSEAIIILSGLLVALWFAIKVPLNLAWIILSNRKLFKIKYRSRTFRHFRIGIILTGLFLFITALGHVLPFSLMTRDVIDTIFMLFLSWAFFPLIRLRHLMLDFFSRGMKGYWFLVLRVVSLLIPLLLLAVSLLGLIGYINLGWYIERNLGLLILVLTGWLIVRGLINDILLYFKNIALKHSSFSLLWTQDLIPLIGNLINLAVLIGAVAVYFFLSGWGKDHAIMEAINSFLSYELITLEKEVISVLTLFKTLALLWFVFWFAGWMRQITYRWIYLNISDLGVRLSLSVFTQYILVISGLLITLNLIGIDLTTLTVFFGALGVGIGFGLQTIANNFISGLILLIERPLKTGDFVNIGSTCEGEVTSIGIRSTIVRQWNRQEVFVPNAEVISNAFTNWTHTDHILRTTLYVHISYDTEPEFVLSTLKDIFKQQSEVLIDPAPFITLWEFAESWMLFRLDYYINLRHSDMFAMRSRVGVAMWQALKAAGIKVAYPQQDVHLRSALLSAPNTVLTTGNESNSLPAGFSWATNIPS